MQEKNHEYFWHWLAGNGSYFYDRPIGIWPKKLPEIGRSMGKAIRGFQDASRDFESEFTREAKQLEEAVATSSKPETEKLAAANPKEDSADI